MLKQLIFKAFVFLLGIFSIIFGGKLMANQPAHDKCPGKHYTAPATHTPDDIELEHGPLRHN